jgi:hypothetical protein
MDQVDIALRGRSRMGSPEAIELADMYREKAADDADYLLKYRLCLTFADWRRSWQQ